MLNRKSISVISAGLAAAGVSVCLMIFAVATPDSERTLNSGLPSGTDGNRIIAVSEQTGTEGHKPNNRIDSGRLAPSKPMSVLHFVKPVRYQADSGETLKVSLTLVASEDVSNVAVEANAEPGLALPALTKHALGALKAGQEVVVVFDVTTLAEGRLYVNVLASADAVSGRHMSSYSIPVKVGNVRSGGLQKSAAKTVTDDQGNRLILMRAETPKTGEQPR